MTRAALLLLLAAGLAPAGELDVMERAVTEAAREVRSSVVTVFTPGERRWDLTGVLVAPGVVLTLRKPLLDEQGALLSGIEVRFPDGGKTVAAELIEDDEPTNTVLLRARGGRGKTIRPRFTEHVHHGLWVLLVGNTFRSGRESDPVVSLGVISGLVRDADGVAALHASMLVNPGSFGAPVVDLDGGLLGVLDAAVTDAGQQSVVIPYERIHLSYERRHGQGSRALGTRPYRKPSTAYLHDLLGIVTESAAQTGARALVGVRSGDVLPRERQPAAADPAETDGGEPGKGQEQEGSGEEEGERKDERAQPEGPRPQPAPPQRRRVPAQPPPVPGSLPGTDRASGTILTPDGLVLCPLRVTGWPGPIRSLYVDLADGSTKPATLLGYDERLRVALLSIRAENLPVLEAAPADELRAGTFAMALGYPHEEPASQTPQLTFGILSRTGALGNLHPAFDALQTDAGVAGGNRGGPLVDVEGRLMGVLLDVNDTEPAGYMLRAQGRYAGNSGLGFALPLSVIRALLPRLREGVVFKPAFLGVRTVPAEKGLRVVEVIETNSRKQPTSAKTAGLKPNDLLVELAGEPLRAASDLGRALGAFTVGDEVELAFERDGERRTVRIRLGER